MKMVFSFGGHTCSIPQVVVLVVCFRGYVSGEMVQGCVESQLNLSCPEMKVIQITAVVLGDSKCLGKKCCIRDDDCTHNANENHRTDVQCRCDNKQSCTVRAYREEIPCGNDKSVNDFERITYKCRDEPRNVTMNNSTGDSDNPDSESDDNTNQHNSATVGIVIACGVCLIVIIAIVASVSVVTHRRKKRRQVKSSDAVKMSDIETDRKEVIYMNETQGTSLIENAGSTIPVDSNNSTEVEASLNSGAKNLESPTSDYCEIEEVAIGRIQSDSEYEQLENYEPLIVYEQLQ